MRKTRLAQGEHAWLMFRLAGALEQRVRAVPEVTDTELGIMAWVAAGELAAGNTSTGIDCSLQLQQQAHAVINAHRHLATPGDCMELARIIVDRCAP